MNGSRTKCWNSGTMLLSNSDENVYDCTPRKRKLLQPTSQPRRNRELCQWALPGAVCIGVGLNLKGLTAVINKTIRTERDELMSIENVNNWRGGTLKVFITAGPQWSGHYFDSVSLWWLKWSTYPSDVPFGFCPSSIIRFVCRLKSRWTANFSPGLRWVEKKKIRRRRRRFNCAQTSLSLLWLFACFCRSVSQWKS